MVSCILPNTAWSPVATSRVAFLLLQYIAAMPGARMSGGSPTTAGPETKAPQAAKILFLVWISREALLHTY